MKTETQKQIERLQAELDKLKVLAEGEQKFEVGRWYRSKSSKGIVLFKQIGSNSGFCNSRTWSDHLEMSNINFWTPATDTEVLEVFTNYFRSKGFKKGSKFKSAWSGDEHTYDEALLFCGKDILSFRGIVFDSDRLTLATLIEEEKIYIGENEVIFCGSLCSVNGTIFNKEDIESIKYANPIIFGKILKRMEG